MTLSKGPSQHPAMPVCSVSKGCSYCLRPKANGISISFSNSDGRVFTNMTHIRIYLEFPPTAFFFRFAGKTTNSFKPAYRTSIAHSFETSMIYDTAPDIMSTLAMEELGRTRLWNQKLANDYCDKVNDRSNLLLSSPWHSGSDWPSHFNPPQ